MRPDLEILWNNWAPSYYTSAGRGDTRIIETA
jgi:hypothetical protein